MHLIQSPPGEGQQDLARDNCWVRAVNVHPDVDVVHEVAPAGGLELLPRAVRIHASNDDLAFTGEASRVVLPPLGIATNDGIRLEAVDHPLRDVELRVSGLHVDGERRRSGDSDSSPQRYRSRNTPRTAETRHGRAAARSATRRLQGQRRRSCNARCGPRRLRPETIAGNIGRPSHADLRCSKTAMGAPTMDKDAVGYHRSFRAWKPNPSGAVVSAPDDDAVRRVGAYRLKPRQQLRDLAAVRQAHARRSEVRVHVHVEHALSSRAASVDSLCRRHNGVAPDACTHVRRIEVVLVGDRRVPRKQHHAVVPRGVCPCDRRRTPRARPRTGAAGRGPRASRRTGVR